LVDLPPFLLPAGSCWTMHENRTVGAMQKRRGVRSGWPDLSVICNGKVCVELKSVFGVVSKAQKRMREELLRSGADWWLARSAPAAVAALHLSGVPLRSRFGGRFRPPKLAAWGPERLRREHPMAIAARSAVGSGSVSGSGRGNARLMVGLRSLTCRSIGGGAA
jgi:hypothetical protein